MRKPILCALGVLLSSLSAAQGTRLLRQPTISAEHVAFSYAGDLWITDLAGGDARRLTSFPGVEDQPCFSPDGKTIAFTASYDGNADVYTVPIEGGSPRRLTFHPGGDTVQGWTHDGSAVVFTSGRASAPVGYTKLFSVPAGGGPAELLLDARVWHGKLSGDGSKFAYQHIRALDQEWRNHRGGSAHPVWVLDLYDHGHVEIPGPHCQNWHPCWVGDKVYFLSDRDLAMNLYVYDPATRDVTQLTHNREFDAKELESDGERYLIYEVGGYLHQFDTQSGQARQLKITVRGDLPWRRPHWENVGQGLTNAALSPTGKRAIFEARGDIFSVPVEAGDWRNLTNSPGVADRAPSWSPDGGQVAWFSDAGGEYGLMIADQDGLGTPRRIELPDATFYYTPTWSPDGKYVAYTDEGLNLGYVDVESGTVQIADTDQYAHPARTVNPTWAPDSKWIAYTRRLDNQHHAVFVYSVETQTAHQITDGMSDAISPTWDASGKYLYFLSSTNLALNTGWLDMTSYERPIQYSAWLAVLAKGEPSPLLPTSDEEPVKEVATEDVKPAEKPKDDGPVVTIDFDGLERRMLALPVGVDEYAGIVAGTEGVVFLASAGDGFGVDFARYDVKQQESKEFLSGVRAFVLSSDRKQALVQAGGWRVVGTEAAPPAGKGALSTSGIAMKVDPPAEWQQMFRESWRYQRDYLYVENVHGADWDAIYRMYQPWVEHVGHRSDLTYLLDILGGEVAVGHSYTFGGDTPDVDSVSVGLLGADYAVDSGRYRITNVLTGESWNPNLRAPLASPGVDVSEGDYLVAVNGVELAHPTNLYSLFEGTAGRQTVIEVNDRPSRDGAREVTVVPVGNEGELRRFEWVEGNRRRVDEASGGRLAYVWLPNTGQGGYTYFNRYYFAQQHKDGAVVDERFNGGGSAADYMVELMSRERHGYFNSPVGDRKPFSSPQAGIWGPKVLLINDSAGSGGDYLPFMFRKMKIGPLIGTTTWGGLVGIWDVPPLIDGGQITAPRGGFFDMNGRWSVENEGVSPDIEVDQTPRVVLAGSDPQLERGITECLRLLEANPVKRLEEPAPPIRAERPKKR